MAWRLATWPTSRCPSGVNATTDGVTRPPSAFGSTCGVPPSIAATTELVVPRSIPTALAIAPPPLPGSSPYLVEPGGRSRPRESPFTELSRAVEEP